MSKPFNHVFWERGFRPFFLFGGFYAIWSVLAWTAQMHGQVMFDMPLLDPVLWHGHEMVFGFTLAIVAGFLLTAVANWTGWAPVREGHLAGLVLLWLAGRVVMHWPPIPYGITAIIQLSFLPALAISLAVPLLKTWNKRNYVFLLLLSIMFACNAAILFYESKAALYVSIFVIIAMISLIGGRVIPVFTIAGLRMKGRQVVAPPQPRMDVACLLSLIALMVSFGFTGANETTGVVALISAGLHAFRMRFYNITRIWIEPMVWVLHLGYLWLVAGLALIGLAGFGIVPISPAVHALTAGSIGSMTIGMMVRVSLGHTGRPIQAGKIAVAAFIFMQLAALARVMGPLVWDEHYLIWIGTSGVFWAGAFGLYVLGYGPMLWQKRVVREAKPHASAPDRLKGMKIIQDDSE